MKERKDRLGDLAAYMYRLRPKHGLALVKTGNRTLISRDADTGVKDVAGGQ